MKVFIKLLILKGCDYFIIGTNHIDFESRKGEILKGEKYHICSKESRTKERENDLHGPEAFQNYIELQPIESIRIIELTNQAFQLAT